MPQQDISVQILTQQSESIQKLFDLSTRIDERLKSVLSKQDDFDGRLENVIKTHSDLLQRLVVVESKDSQSIKRDLDSYSKEMIVLDKRLTAIETTSKGFEGKWNGFISFAVQLVWIVLAAWVLLKLNLQSP